MESAYPLSFLGISEGVTLVQGLGKNAGWIKTSTTFSVIWVVAFPMNWRYLVNSDHGHKNFRQGMFAVIHNASVVLCWSTSPSKQEL